MSGTKQVFSTLPYDESSRDPDQQVLRLSAQWRRERNLDDSAEHIEQSVTAVLRQHPELARAYAQRADLLAYARDKSEAFAKVEMVRS